MRALILAATALAAAPAFAADIVPDSALGGQQRHGRDLFAQHCVVCHVRTLITSQGNWGPALSSQTLGGDAKAIANFVSYGTDKMPGFRLSLTPAEIADVASYVKLFPAPAAPK
jgi:mono/diheme cytochrome c family protein